MSHGVKIKVSDFKDFAQKYETELLAYKDWLQTYLDHLKRVCDEAVVSGRIHDALTTFRKELVRALPMPEVVAQSVKQLVSDYLDELHEAQVINGVSVLYDRDYKGFKDYTSEYFYQLEQMSEAADYASGFFNSFFDILEDAYYGIGKFFGFYDNSKEENIKKTQEALLQYNDVTRRQVRNIKRRIYDADDRYCERLMLVKDFLHELEEYICVFRDAMINYQYQPTLFDISEIDFQSKYFAMLEAYNNVLVMNTVTDADVEAFINSEAAAEFMNEQVQIIYDYIADLSQIEITDYDFWKLVIFQMFDITEGQIASGGEYDQLIMKKELTEMLDELAGCYVYSDSDEQAALDSVEAVIKEAKKQGKNIYEFLNSIRGKDGKLILDGRTKSAKKFLKFLNGLDNLQDILKYGDQALEILTKLFIDYDKNLAFLDSFEKNANLSEDMMACLAS